MPFDSTDVETPADRRARLIKALREPMPPGFTWNYHRADSCALGLARRMDINPHTLGLNERDYTRIFFYGLFYGYYWCLPLRITPKMVAKKLEKIKD